jgi:hypothetical protein
MRNSGDSRDLRKRPWDPSTPAGCVDTRCGHRLNRAADHEALSGGDPEDLASLIAKASWQIECATHASHIGEPMSEILSGFTIPSPSTVFSTEASKLPVLLTRQRSPVRISPVEADFTRQSAIVAGRRQRWSSPLPFSALNLV